MKDIPIIRIFRYFLAVMICLFFVANVLSNEARASDTGTITIEALSNNSYSIGGANVVASTNWTTFSWASTSYNYISWFRINDSSTAYTLAGTQSFSRFTCVLGCTGGGAAYYDRVVSGDNVTWVFDTTTTFQSSPVQLSYDNVSFAGSIVEDTTFAHNPAAAASATQPVHFLTTNSAFEPTIDYYVVTSVRTDNTYVADWFTNGLGLQFNLTVTKGTISTGVNVTNAAGAMITAETSLNTDDYAIISVSNGTGLALNISIAGGYTSAIVNSTGYAIADTNEPSDNELNGIGLIWNSSTYTLGSTGNVTWAKTTPALSCDNIKIYNKFNTLVSTILNPEDSGFFKILLNDTGTWKAEYTRKSLCVGSEQVLNTAYTTVTEAVTSYLIINETTIAGQSENVTYRSGIVSSFAPYLAVINDQGLPEGQFSISGYSANTEGTSSVVIVSSGQHVIKICDAFGCDPVVAVTNTVFNTSIPTLNITQSNITLDSSTYQFEDTGIVTYAIDSTNFSNKAFLITSYNWDYAIEQTRQVGLAQTGSFEELFSQFLGRYIYTGNYSMRLVGRNDSGDTIVAFTNFTISDIDSEGYKLKMSKGELCIGEKNTFVVMSPTTSYLNITLNTNGAIFNSYFINMNKTISYKPAYAGTYSVLLISPEGYTKRAYTFDAKSCAVVNASTDFQNGDAMEQKTDDFLSTGMFIVMIILLIFAGAGLEFGGIGGSIIGFGAGFIFLAIYGLVPLWSLFLFAILVITAFAIFLGEKITGQGGN